MTKNLKVLATLALTATFAVGYAQNPAGSMDAPRKVVHHRKPAQKGPSLQSQIEELRQQEQMDRGQIDTLKQQLSDRDSQLQQAQQAAQQAQQAAEAAQKAANDQQQTLSANQQAVTSLQSSVSDLKDSSSAFQVKVQKQVDETKKAVGNPDAVHYKGITVSPAGSFTAAESYWRQGATGGGLNTAFGAVPINNSDASQLSESGETGRQSRLALKATGNYGDTRLTGYYEMDWLGTGITSNNNQSNSYVLRMRQLWGQASFASGWQVTGGQMWSLTAETTHGLDNGTEILPATIDPQYEAGFVWNRQYGMRVTKDIANKFWMGMSAENDQILTAGNGLPKNELVGSGGNGGGLLNSTANYSYNMAPELVAKMAFEPGWGHWELFGVGRFFHERIYPTGASPYNDSVVGGGFGAGFRAPLGTKKITIGLKGLYGDGTGRMGSSTIGDTTFRPDGSFALLHTLSALSTLEMNPNKRLMLYFNYGGDYVGRRYFGTGGEGYGSPYTSMTGCTTEPAQSSGPYPAGVPNAPGNCGGNTKDVAEFTAGDWYDFYNGPHGRLRFGLQYSRFDRALWSGIGGTTNPGGGAHGIDNMFFTSFRYYMP